MTDLVRHARADEVVRERAVPLFVKRLADDHPRVRAAAAVALGDLDAREGVCALLVAIEDDDAHVRQMVLSTLGEVGDVRVLPRLRRALEDARPEIRYQAVIAFARVADRIEDADPSEVDEVLLGAVGDPDDAIAHIALRVAEERLDAGRRPDARLLARARAIVGAEAAHTASPHVVLAAAIVLAKAGDERGHATVLRVVRREKIGGTSPEKEDEQAAVELVGELGLGEAIPHLERRVWGVARFVRDTCSFHARIALARMGHPRAVAEITGELVSPKREVLSAAVVAAGRARILATRDRITALSDAAVDPALVREAVALLDSAMPSHVGRDAGFDEQKSP